MHAQAQPCRVRGVAYSSQSAAARALGLTPAAVCKALNDGREDRVGLPRPDGKPVRALGRTWHSHGALARHLGCSREAVSKAVREDRLGEFLVRWGAE